MIIRNARLEDIETIVELGSMMHAESRFKVLGYNHTKTAQFFENIFGLDDYLMIVCEWDGAIVGGFVGYVTPHWFSDDLIASDLGLFLSRSYRGTQCAKHLIKHYVQWAKDKGIHHDFILLGISTGFQVKRTERFYQHMGFETHGVLMNLRGDQ